jgi:hypothetical protein
MERIYWVLFGGCFVASMSVFTVLLGNNLLGFAGMPMPVPQLGWLLRYGIFGFLVMPAVYASSTFILSQTKYFPHIVMVAAALLGFTNGIWFAAEWRHGIAYYLELAPRSLAVNSAGFGIASFLAWKSARDAEKSGVYAANLIVFLLLSWCAFPCLGECSP